MKTSSLILATCACVFVALARPYNAAAQEGATALVEEIRGTAFWRRNDGAKRERLDPKSDKARRLYPGEQVLCLRGSLLRLRIGGEPRTAPVARWYTIPPLSSSRSDPIRIMLDHYGGPSGIDRASPIQVFSPPQYGAARLRPFVIRWMPTAAGCTFSLLIQDVVGNRIWRKHDVDGAAGSLSDPSAEQDLEEYRAKNGQAELTLTVSDSCDGSTQVSFSLLSVAKEQSLTEELAFWDKQTGTFVPHLGRASVYDRYRMFTQAAEEYEAALNVAPESRQLLLRTIAANRATGNLTRASELKKRLPKTTLPTRREQ